MSEKTFAIMLTILGIVLIFSLGIAAGYKGGINRAIKSARLVSYTDSGYEISYDLAGTHYYE